MSLKSMPKIVLAVALAAAVAGCGIDDVQLEGKVFDAMGMNSTAERKAPEIKARPGIVVPPNLAALPEPGAPVTEQADIGGIQDYDAKRTVSQSDLERQQKEYCEKHYDMARAMGNQDDALVEGPMGRCQKSILSAIGGVNVGGE